MRYKLSDNFELCGFKNLPFAIYDKRGRRYEFCDLKSWELFQRAAYGHCFAEGELHEDEQKLLDKMIKNKVIIPAAEDEKVIIPPYHKHKNRYRESVQWSITGKCNARCKHCFMSAPDAKMGEPTLEQCFDIIKMLDECGTRMVAITGGEPFVRKDFWQIIDKMIEHNLVLTTLYSNGILVDQKLLDGFIQRNMHPSWQISFDGIDGWHDWMRGVPGATEYAVNAIRLLLKNGFNVSCATSFFKGNVGILPETIDFLAELGVSSVKIGCMLPQGEWLKYPEQWLTNEEELNFYLSYIPQYIRKGRPITLQCEGLFMGYSDKAMAAEGVDMPGECRDCKDPDKCSRKGEKEEPKPKAWRILLGKKCPEDKEHTYAACEVLSNHYYIGATGAVLPCMSLEDSPAGNKFPNLFEQPLVDILTDSYYTQMSDATIGDVNDHNPECRECEHKLICNAGCRASAVGPDGDDYLAIDKRTCMMVKEGWPAKLMAAIESCNGTE